MARRETPRPPRHQETVMEDGLIVAQGEPVMLTPPEIVGITGNATWALPLFGFDEATSQHRLLRWQVWRRGIAAL